MLLLLAVRLAGLRGSLRRLLGQDEVAAPDLGLVWSATSACFVVWRAETISPGCVVCRSVRRDPQSRSKEGCFVIDTGTQQAGRKKEET